MILSLSAYLLLASVGFTLIALAILFALRITPWTPFHMALVSMAVVAIFAVWPQMAGDNLGRTQYGPIKVEVAATILAGSIFFAITSLLFRRRREAELPRPDEYPDGVLQMNRNIVAGVCLGVCLFSALSAYRRLGSLTLLAMGSDQPLAGDLSQGEAMAGIVPALGRGASRVLPFLAVVEFIYCFDSLRVFIRKRLFLCACTAAVLFLEIFDGQRTQIILPLATVFFALAVAGRVSTRLVVIAAVCAAVFFVVVGEFRIKNFTESFRLNRSTGLASIDTPLIWLVTYSEPSIYNFNNLARLHPEPTFGLCWFSQIAPGFIVKLLIKSPLPAAAILSDANAFAQPGLTLRTSYADWYRDFGFAGAVFPVAITWLLTLYAFNKSRLSPRMLWLYLCLAYATANLAFLNLFIGVPFVMPLLLLPWIRGSRTAIEEYNN
jgi:oligosaccharide repeat unit polymerase